jgi:hypothetical protein
MHAILFSNKDIPQHLSIPPSVHTTLSWRSQHGISLAILYRFKQFCDKKPLIPIHPKAAAQRIVSLNTRSFVDKIFNIDSLSESLIIKV